MYDDHDKLGGMLRYSDCSQTLDSEVLEKEVDLIKRLGFEFFGQTRIDSLSSLEKLRQKFDAVFVAVGGLPNNSEYLGLAMGQNGVEVNDAYETNVRGVFAGGDAVRRRRLAVRSVADGKNAAIAIDQFLSGMEVAGPQKKFNSRVGKLLENEIDSFMLLADHSSRVSPLRKIEGFSDDQAKQESSRCMHCDCRKKEGCGLREYSQQYQAKSGRYKGERKLLFSQQIQHPEVIYEQNLG